MIEQTHELAAELFIIIFLYPELIFSFGYSSDYVTSNNPNLLYKYQAMLCIVIETQ